jgi:hypothetical protein
LGGRDCLYTLHLRGATEKLTALIAIPGRQKWVKKIKCRQ